MLNNGNYVLFVKGLNSANTLLVNKLNGLLRKIKMFYISREPQVLFSMNDTYGRTKNDDILPEESHVHQHEQVTRVNQYL